MVCFEADIDLDATFGCGQCFRWLRLAHGGWSGVAHGRELTVRRDGPLLLLEGAGEDERGLWQEYFDLGRDYGAVRALLAGDTVFAKAAAFAPGMRLLRQESWEALCSFILSQNNNIPRIRGIIERLCENFGERLAGGGYAFPTAHRLACISEKELAPLRCGFRAGYIADAARKVDSGEVDLSLAARMPLDEARALLQKIHGVGPKVAECTLLFGCGRVECFPVDVWIRRAMACYFPQGLPGRFEPVGGIAQQLLFHYVRCCPDAAHEEALAPFRRTGKARSAGLQKPTAAKAGSAPA
ncbi:MAG: DNA glycosylase [Clostridia bacterium]|nr:DNA glycosylase [Clostridia bacterium]